MNDRKPNTRDDKPVALGSATCDPKGHTVTLPPRGKVPKQPFQLSITAPAILDTHGQALDGDRDAGNHPELVPAGVKVSPFAGRPRPSR